VFTISFVLAAARRGRPRGRPAGLTVGLALLLLSSACASASVLSAADFAARFAAAAGIGLRLDGFALDSLLGGFVLRDCAVAQDEIFDLTRTEKPPAPDDNGLRKADFGVVDPAPHSARDAVKESAHGAHRHKRAAVFELGWRLRCG
jgi:hypothetical protein